MLCRSLDRERTSISLLSRSSSWQQNARRRWHASGRCWPTSIARSESTTVPHAVTLNQRRGRHRSGASRRSRGAPASHSTIW